MAELDAKEEYLKQVRRWRGLAGALVIAHMITLIFFFIIYLHLVDASEQRSQEIADIQEVLGILEQATGPEAQQQQQQVIDRLVLEIDCNTQEVFQRTIDQIAELADIAGIVVILPECLEE